MNSSPQNEAGAAVDAATPGEGAGVGNLDERESTTSQPPPEADRAAVVQLALGFLKRHGMPTTLAVLGAYGASKPADLQPRFLGNVTRDFRLLDADRTPLPASPPMPNVEIGTPIIRRILPPFTKSAAERLRANVPAPLRDLTAWVCASREPRELRGAEPKSSKAPLNPRDGSAAKSNDPKTWGTFATAIEHALGNPRVFGIGLNLLGSEFLGLDLDRVLDDVGALHPSVADVLLSLPRTYCERSPSGTGLRLFYVGEKPAWLQGSAWANAFGDGLGLEVYDASSKRYLTVTGDVVDVRALRVAGAS